MTIAWLALGYTANLLSEQAPRPPPPQAIFDLLVNKLQHKLRPPQPKSSPKL